MNKTHVIMNAITVGLPEIKQVLGSDWLQFTQQLQAQAEQFQRVTDEEVLYQAANQFLGLFIVDERVANIISPLIVLPPQQKHHSQHQRPPKTVRLSTIANRFYLLAQFADDVADGKEFEMLEENKTRKNQRSSEKRQST